MEKQTQVTQRVSTEVCVMQELGSGTPYSGEMSYIIFFTLYCRLPLASVTTNLPLSQNLQQWFSVNMFINHKSKW